MNGAETFFSIKQMKNSGFLFRLDKELIHGTEQMSIHATYRFNLFGYQFGSSKTQFILLKFPM